MARKVQISVYCMYEWWLKYFHCAFPLPERPCDAALETLYLARQKFLYEHFADFNIGDPAPKANGEYLNMIARYSLDFVPHLLGVELKAYDGGGYTPRHLDEEQVRSLKPVCLENTPMGEWIQRRKEKLTARYGSAVSNIALEGPLNLANRVRGEEFFFDMYDDAELAHHLLNVITETAADVYRFQRKYFGPTEINIANCLASAMLSPESYSLFGLPYDRRLAAMSEEITGKERGVKLHHCDARIDAFAPYYAQMPQIHQVEARTTSSAEIIRSAFPGADFSAMVNCTALAEKPVPQLITEDIEPALREDITASVDMWSFSTETSPERLKDILEQIRLACGKYAVEPEYSMIPFYWEELEWAFPRWESRLDDWVRRLGE